MELIELSRARRSRTMSTTPPAMSAMATVTGLKRYSLIAFAAKKPIASAGRTPTMVFSQIPKTRFRSSAVMPPPKGMSRRQKYTTTDRIAPS